MNVLLMASFLALGQGDPCYLGDLPFDPPFACPPYRIERAIADAVIPYCSDTIEVCIGTTVPAKHEMSPVTSPVQLYRMGVAGESVSPEQIETEWDIDTVYGRLLVMPRASMPPVRRSDGRAYQYRLVVDCRYWKGPEADTVRYDISKQTMILAHAFARSVHDSTDLAAEVFVAPPPASTVHHVGEGLRLEAEERSGPWSFERWESSNVNVAFDPLAPVQVIQDACWPLQDTVIFTAWFRNTSTSVDGENNPAERADQHYFANAPAILWNSSTQEVVVSDRYMWTSLSVIDVNGRTVGTLTSTHGSSLRLPATPALYAVVMTTARGAIIHPFFTY
jgi:hypothetical protein